MPQAVFRPFKRFEIHDFEELKPAALFEMVVRGSLAEHAEVDPYVFTDGRFAWTRIVPEGEAVAWEFLRGIGHVSFLWFTELHEPIHSYRVRYRAHDLEVRLFASQSVESRAISRFLRRLKAKSKRPAETLPSVSSSQASKVPLNP